MSGPCKAVVRIAGRIARDPRALALAFLLLVFALAWSVRDSHHESAAQRQATSAIATRNCRQIETLKAEIRGIIDDGFKARPPRYRHVHQGEYDRARARFKRLPCPGDGEDVGD